MSSGCKLCGGRGRVAVMPFNEDEPVDSDCPSCLAERLPPTINENAVGYDVDDAATCLNLSVATVRRLVAAGSIAATRGGVGQNSPLRFTGKALSDYANGGSKEKTEPKRRGGRRRRAVFPGIND